MMREDDRDRAQYKEKTCELRMSLTCQQEHMSSDKAGGQSAGIVGRSEL